MAVILKPNVKASLPFSELDQDFAPKGQRENCDKIDQSEWITLSHGNFSFK